MRNQRRGWSSIRIISVSITFFKRCAQRADPRQTVYTIAVAEAVTNVMITRIT